MTEFKIESISKSKVNLKSKTKERISRVTLQKKSQISDKTRERL